MKKAKWNDQEVAVKLFNGTTKEFGREVSMVASAVGTLSVHTVVILTNESTEGHVRPLQTLNSI